MLINEGREVITIIRPFVGTRDDQALHRDFLSGQTEIRNQGAQEPGEEQAGHANAVAHVERVPSRQAVQASTRRAKNDIASRGSNH